MARDSTSNGQEVDAISTPSLSRRYLVANKHRHAVKFDLSIDP